ncbi:MAG: TIGR04442 family protein [Desulfuromonadales bacterium]|nr:TIGR04442 family protein [Desulfuromonadales bacterium]
MYQEVRLHGHIDDTVEYFATAASRDAYRCYFYETDGKSLRLFSPGNEFVLDKTGITHRGNGGSFCEYMFGVDQPLADLAKGDVRNRLVLYGAAYGEDGTLAFTDRTDGEISFERIFFEGNAVYNYSFFLTGSVTGRNKNQQESILRLLGKLLKRSQNVGLFDDADLVEDMFNLLGHKSSLYLVKLINKKHKAYHDAFSKLYLTRKSIPDQEFADLRKLAERLNIDKYQQERIRIDVMYKHPDNRRIVDEYKSILIDCNQAGKISREKNARLTRLKTLSVRNKIPTALFYTLDEMLKHDKLIDYDEQVYIAETREILAGIFLHESEIDAGINNEDMIRLLHAKRLATDNRDHLFEQILLDTGKTCDEKIRDGADLMLLEAFSYIITYFDRYDSTSANVNQLAFMENVVLTEEVIRSLLGNRHEFNELQPGLFDQLFFEPMADNKYFGNFGRKKVDVLRKGLIDIVGDRMTVQGLLDQLGMIDAEEKLYRILLEHIKERIRNFYSKYNTKAEQEALCDEVTEELLNKQIITDSIPKGLFRDVVVNIKKEAVYIHNLLPEIIADRDVALREDFLENSGLDRFYVEELEREFFEHNGLDLEQLYEIRKGLSAGAD